MCFGTGVEIKSIVEKGLWDDLFPLEGGGHIHMKLQFVLSEEERSRIRMMVQYLLSILIFNNVIIDQFQSPPDC